MGRLKTVGLLLTSVFSHMAFAQETRSMIYGRVLDVQAASVVGAQVTVTNTDTNASTSLVTNQTGYYEANLLLPGNYRVTAEAAGFRKAIRQGIVLTASTRAEVNVNLDVGGVAESVTVVAEAPLLDAASASTGRVVDNRTQAGLPVSFNNTTILARLTPGVQAGGEIRVLGPFDQVSDSDYTVAGNVGGNEWYLDGASNSSSRIVAYVPHSDTVAEMKVETSGFDAAFGHSTGVAISIMTKSGNNQLHGSASDLHTEDRFNAASFFPKQLYFRNIDAAMAAGNVAQAQRLRNTPMVPSGHRNHYALTIGGPVVIPKIYNGKDKLFFFFDYVGLRSVSTTDSQPQYLNNTFPTLANRQGDFSRLLQVNAPLYTVYDPLSVRPDAARPGHYIRDPIPGNILPSSRITNPVYNTYVKFLPTPNNDPADPRNQPSNNFLQVGIPFTNFYKTFSNRIDYNHSEHHRMYVRWLWDLLTQNTLDWTYNTPNVGLMAGNQSRHNSGGVADWVYTPRASTIFDFSVSINEYRDDQTGQGNSAKAAAYKPSDVGLPAYLDDKAGSQHVLPLMAVSGYNNIGPAGAQSFNHYRVASTKADATHIMGSHTLHAGFDGRQYFLTGYGGAAINSSGNFSFGNTYTRRNDDTFTSAGTLGLSWAAFMMGTPDSATINTTDSYATHNPAYAWYGQDNWRVTPKLTLNFGLRVEYELGPTERYNRLLGYFDPNLQLPIAAAAQAAYAQNPVQGMPAANFVVQGGSTYAATGGVGRKVRQNELKWLPRLAAAYQLNSKTVIRGGYGIFYDSLNVLDQNGSNSSQNPNQLNFSRTTSTVFTNDFGVTWLAGNPLAGISPMRDPFPVRSDGTRFDTPTRTALGPMAVVGRSLTYNAFATHSARQQRWRVGLQRQIGTSMIFEAYYTGSYANRVYVTQKLDPLPAQYWATGNVRNDAMANAMNANLPNPFLLSNFASLKTTSPLVYQDMSTLGFYTSSTIRANQLLRAYPQMTSLSRRNANVGEARTDDLELNFERRFSRGFNAFVTYTRMRDRNSDIYLNEYDPAPSWRESNNARPHRITASGIWELPFGKGRAFAHRGPQNILLGGWQIGVTYEFQPGALIDFGNLFYNGNLSDINTGTRTFTHWFNTAGFVTDPAKQPAAYQARVFPTRIDGLRADFTNIANGCLQREFQIRERAKLQFRVDALNLQNRSQMAAPVLDPTATNFAQITAQSRTQNRFYQFQLRLRF